MGMNVAQRVMGSPVARSACTVLCAALLAAGTACRRAPEPPEPEPTAQEPQIHLPHDRPPPQFEFPAEVRSRNESLNRFIEDLREICQRGEYRRYRLAVSRRVDPLSEEQFRAAWLGTAKVRIEAIRRLPDTPDLPEGGYGVLVRVIPRENSEFFIGERLIGVLVFQEDGRWVTAPAPPEVRDALRRLVAPESTQPAGTDG